MSGEYYIYDEPAGLHQYESQERLAWNVVKNFIQYENLQHKATLTGEVEDIINPCEVDTPLADEPRLSSLVESPTAYHGYVFAAARTGDMGPALMGAILCQVKRDPPVEIVKARPVLITRPDPIDVKLYGSQSQQEVSKLTERFDKTELEIMMRVLHKMSSRLEVELAVKAMEDDDLPPQAARDHRDRFRMRASLPVEPVVRRALVESRLAELSAQFPADRRSSSQPPPAATGERRRKLPVEHIAEWTDFIDAAHERLKRADSADQPLTHSNIQHEHGGKSYYIKLAAEYGQLFGIQLLCDDTGAWKSQKFALHAEDGIEQADLNLLSPIWDKEEVLASLRTGETISDESYEYYRSLAEDGLTAVFNAPEQLITIQTSS